MESLAQITPASIALFFLYTLVALLAAFVARIGVGTMGEKAKNQAVAAVTTMVADAVKESRDLSSKLLDEREKRANIEGKVDSLMTQVNQERSRADTANERLATQTAQIDHLTKEVSQLTSDIHTIRERLSKVEAEKRALEDEKHKLENALSTQGEEYRKLMDNIQERINQAVADVREALRLEYEERISKLENEIRRRDVEIAALKAQLKESESHEKATATSDPVAPNPSPDSTSAGTGSDTSAASPEPGSSDKPGGGSPSA